MHTEPRKSAHHVAWMTGGRELLRVGSEMYIAPISSGFDARYGSRAARWECSKAHYDRFFDAVYKAQIIEG